MARKTKYRRRGRHRGASGKANADLTAHIESLGLASINEYKTWCHEHGYTGALNKSWQERRQERAVAEQEKDARAAGADLELHLEQLGLANEVEYQEWCKQNGLSPSLKKGTQQRRKELDLADRIQGDAVLARTRRQAKRLPDSIRAIHSGGLDQTEANQPILEKMASMFARLGDRKSRDAYLDLLLHAEQQANLLGIKPAIPALGPVEGNTFVESMGVIAQRHDQWVEGVRTWKPETHNSRRQFGHLVRHLLCKYDVPTFMDSVWFYGMESAARQKQNWFIHVGTGGNIRKADIPLHLTKKMAHLALQSPGNFTVEEAFRRGQILGLGGEEPLVRAVNATLLGRSFENEDFWSKVIHFFVNNPMLDPDQVGPIVDYIRNQKYVAQEVALPDGGTRVDPPAQPNFSVKGRSLDKLIREVDAWHAQLARDAKLPDRTWAESGIDGYEADEGEKGHRWTIHEITNTRELTQEGRGMGHCVASYESNCRKGNISVWSMQVQEENERPIRVMTIAVLNKARRVNQARGRFNALPSGKTPNGKRITERKYQTFLKHSRKILFDWRQQEGLTIASRI